VSPEHGSNLAGSTFAGAALVDAWIAELDRLEDATSAIAPGLDWAPPTDLGPLPEDLRPRAVRIAAAQQQAIRRATDAKRTTASHLTAVGAAAPAPVRAVYLDLDA
jgi:hypothetical protein